MGLFNVTSIVRAQLLPIVCRFQEGAAAHKAEDAGNPLGQAYLKYLDAMVLNETKGLYNFHVGRLLVTQGNYPAAMKRLEASLCWNPRHHLTR